MNTGCALAVAMEAGVLSFGDIAAALDLVRQIGRFIFNSHFIEAPWLSFKF